MPPRPFVERQMRLRIIKRETNDDILTAHPAPKAHPTTISAARARADLRPKQNTIPSWVHLSGLVGNQTRLGLIEKPLPAPESTGRVGGMMAGKCAYEHTALRSAADEMDGSRPVQARYSDVVRRKFTQAPQANCTRPWPTDQFSFADSRTFTNTFSGRMPGFSPSSSAVRRNSAFFCSAVRVSNTVIWMYTTSSLRLTP